MSGLLSVDGKKILHMDRNDYYGAAGELLHATAASTMSSPHIPANRSQSQFD
jgi:RAB protein geranylgeranyltransferase component A